METKNVDGVMIETSVPENLVSNYEAIGWKRVEENKPVAKEEVKEEKKASQNSLNK